MYNVDNVHISNAELKPTLFRNCVAVACTLQCYNYSSAAGLWTRWSKDSFVCSERHWGLLL